MAYDLIIMPQAENDMSQIGEYIALDNPLRAESFVFELEVFFSDIARLKLLSPILSRYKAKQIRKRVFGKYLIFYRYEKQTIYILRVINGARDFAKLL